MRLEAKGLSARGIAIAIPLMIVITISSVAVILIAQESSVVQEVDAFSRHGLRRFSSYEELKGFLEMSQRSFFLIAEGGPRAIPMPIGLPVPIAPAAAVGDVSKTAKIVALELDYSRTNVQVEGVDEADVVKTDGEYLYVAFEKVVIILKAYPPEEARVLSKIELKGAVIGLFVNNDRLIVIAERFEERREKPLSDATTVRLPPSGREQWLSIEVYDISDRGRPALRRDVSVDGFYFASRMIENYVYVLANKPAFIIKGEISLPKVRYNGIVRSTPATDIHYVNEPNVAHVFTTIIALNVFDDAREPKYKTILLGATNCVYVSLDNVYVAVPSHGPRLMKLDDLKLEVLEWTKLYRIRVKGDRIKAEASGEVPGVVLNQFSMDEHEGYFRVTTTSHRVKGPRGIVSENNLYVLDMGLRIIGKLEGLAPNEIIYSARFMGDRCYLVTFKKVDPFFVIDLRDPFNPMVLGELKITGFSGYLHPYDENHVVGIGKEAVPAEEGDFAWFQGVKISLFDVTNVNDPKEIAKYIIGDRGTDSPALYDHKAFLFDRPRSLLAIPVLLAELDKRHNVHPREFGRYVWQGAYVFHISPEEGLVLRGRITHMDYGFKWEHEYFIERILYIEDILYTISKKIVKMNDLESLRERNKVSL